jgi:hypothetical protein
MASEAATQVPRKEAQRTDAILSVLALALQAISSRLVVIVSMVMTFALFAWAMTQGGSLVRLAVAASFAVLVFLPVLWRSHARQDD